MSTAGVRGFGVVSIAVKEGKISMGPYIKNALCPQL